MGIFVKSVNIVNSTSSTIGCYSTHLVNELNIWIYEWSNKYEECQSQIGKNEQKDKETEKQSECRIITHTQ